MAYCTVDSRPVVEAHIRRPRMGVWHADLVVDSAEQLPERVAIAFGSTTLQGTVTHAGVVDDVVRARVVGGAAGLAKDATPKSYINVPLRVPLEDLLRSAGERLSASADAGALLGNLSRWTTTATSCAAALAHLLGSRDLTWRVDAAGEVWLGTEQWAPAELDYELLEEDPLVDRVTIFAEDPALEPGKTFRARRVSYVEHRFGEELRTGVWFE